MRTYSGVFFFKNATDFICDWLCIMHSQHYLNFIDLCRKLAGRSTAYNLAIGLSDGSGERMVSRSKRNGCCHLIRLYTIVCHLLQHILLHISLLYDN